MLKVFEEYLEDLSRGPGDDFHDQIRARIGKRATPVLEKRLKGLVGLVPDILSRASCLCGRQDLSPELKRMIVLVLIYPYRARGFFSGYSRKLFDYLGDAYRMGLAYETILRGFQRAGTALSAGDQEFVRQFRLIKRSVKAVIPEEEQSLSEMIEEVLGADGGSILGCMLREPAGGKRHGSRKIHQKKLQAL